MQITPATIAFCALSLGREAAAVPQNAATTITVSAVLPTNAPSFVDDTQFKSQILNSTNFYRKEHNATAMTWNSSLANFGTDWTDGCVFKHSGGPDGENLAEGYANVTAAIDAWGDERDKYDFSNPGFSEATGHFTQLVWKNTTTVGCGRKFCNGGFTGWYLVCEYYPRGNIIGFFDTQVNKQISGSTSAASTSRPTWSSTHAASATQTGSSVANMLRVKGLWIASLVGLWMLVS